MKLRVNEPPTYDANSHADRKVAENKRFPSVRWAFFHLFFERARNDISVPIHHFLNIPQKAATFRPCFGGVAPRQHSRSPDSAVAGKTVSAYLHRGID